MSLDPARLRTGELLEWHADVGGVRVQLLAEVEVSATTLHLRDVAIYPVGVDRAAVGLAALLRVARAGLFRAVREAGFDRLRVSGTRLSGARPGRIVDVTIDLEREAR